MAGPDEKKPNEFDPDGYRMTLGEHLEELRRRVMLGMVGGVLALLVALYFSERLTYYFAKPLQDGLRNAGLNPQLFVNEITSPFMLSMKVAAIVAACVAAPWMLYQLWQFVAAGLYPNEQKVIKRYIPLSITLLLLGIVLAYVIVMPITVKFLLGFNAGFEQPGAVHHAVTMPATQPVMTIPHLDGDWKDAPEGALWFNNEDGKLKFIHQGRVAAITYTSDSLLAQAITMDTYVELTIMTLLVFGIAFQLPLVVLALHSVGIVSIQILRKSRRIVYFSLAIASAVIAPGDVISAMMSLYIPLILLFEFGIILCWWSDKQKAKRGLVEEAESE